MLHRLPALPPLLAFLDLPFKPALLFPLDRVQWVGLRFSGCSNAGLTSRPFAEPERKVHFGRMREVITCLYSSSHSVRLAYNCTSISRQRVLCAVLSNFSPRFYRVIRTARRHFREHLWRNP